MPKAISKEQLKRLQENLSTFRKITGYSTEEFGELIGLTRQSVTNLETGKTPFTPLHYRAIYHIINEVYAEKILNGENPNPILAIAMTVFIWAYELEEGEYKKWKQIFAQLSTLMSDGVVDDPVATLKGLVLSSYELQAGDLVPADRLLETISEIISGSMNEMAKKIDKAIDTLPEN